MSTEEMCNRYASYSLKDFRISGLKIGTFGRQSTYFVQECLRSDTAQLAGLFFLFELNLLTSDLWSLASGPERLICRHRNPRGSLLRKEASEF